MAIELITGRAGRAHVDSSDVRAFNAYVNAGGRYVLHGGGAEIESANNLHILPAEILMDGAHVRITGTGEEVTLENGASSYDRIDIVALHYTSVGSDDSRVESVALEVIKGTPVDTGGHAQDPAMPVPGTSILDGSSEVYVPYIRVKITGLVPGDPEELLPGRAQMLRDMIAGLMLSDVAGTLPINKGGTGATSAANARAALGLGALATLGSPLPVANGGTGCTSFVGQYGLLNKLYDNYIRDPKYFCVFTDNWEDGGYTTKNDLLKLVYPVGAVYVSWSSTSPASLFGGTWTPITGRFPYFNAGTGTGGSNTTSLSSGNMPSHNHAVATGLENNGTGANVGVAILYNIHHGGAGTLYTNSTGSGSSFNNMPSYQTLYAWRRTA